MLKISAFADEIGSDLDVQIDTLITNQVGYIELRGMWGKNVLDLSQAEVHQIKRRADKAGLGFSAIGSPLGKFPLDGDFTSQMEGLQRALNYAQILQAPYIRMFSFWIPDEASASTHRPQVIDWLGQMIAEAEKTTVILAHENEKGIYGSSAARCLDLLTSLPSPNFTGIFDFANFVQCQQRPYADCWPQLRSHISYFHIKDALLENGQVVPAGMGDGDVAKILSEAFADGFDNFLTLEPHLSEAQASYGRTTPELFKTAADALKSILSDVMRDS